MKTQFKSLRYYYQL